MSKIFLTSQSNFVIEQLSALANINPKETSIAFIINAQKPFLKEYPDPKWVKDEYSKLLELGYIIEKVDLDTLNPNTIYQELQKFDIIYCCGGSALYLIISMRQSGFIKVINRLLSEGKIYVGSSAGSMVCAPSLEMKTILDDSSQANDLIEGMNGDYTGLGLVNFLVSPHFNNPDYIPYFTRMVQFDSPRPEYPILFLTDNQGIWIENNKLEIINKN